MLNEYASEYLFLSSHWWMLIDCYQGEKKTQSVLLYSSSFQQVVQMVLEYVWGRTCSLKKFPRWFRITLILYNKFSQCYKCKLLMFLPGRLFFLLSSDPQLLEYGLSCLRIFSHCESSFVLCSIKRISFLCTIRCDKELVGSCIGWAGMKWESRQNVNTRWIQLTILEEPF